MIAAASAPAACGRLHGADPGDVTGAIRPPPHTTCAPFPHHGATTRSACRLHGLSRASPEDWVSHGGCALIAPMSCGGRATRTSPCDQRFEAIVARNDAPTRGRALRLRASRRGTPPAPRIRHRIAHHGRLAPPRARRGCRRVARRRCRAARAGGRRCAVQGLGGRGEGHQGLRRRDDAPAERDRLRLRWARCGPLVPRVAARGPGGPARRAQPTTRAADRRQSSHRLARPSRPPPCDVRRRRGPRARGDLPARSQHHELAERGAAANLDGLGTPQRRSHEGARAHADRARRAAAAAAEGVPAAPPDDDGHSARLGTTAERARASPPPAAGRA